MLRALIALLLLANLGYFAWSQGWLDAIGLRASGDREPERLQRQVRPELVRILPPGAASQAAAAAAAACFEAGPFNDTELAAAQAAAQLALPAGSWVALRSDVPGTWIVYMGRYASREALAKKEEELKRRQLPFDEVRDNPALAPGLALGRFDTQPAAAQALERLGQAGVHTARVVELAPASSRT
ncbi:MAG TPA: SPOR domain-containing protein, partial [Burkholderiaceae bacterium]|nr:SPOR domain-containing protein [Burkholderiaceae bacterium]